MAVIRAAQIKLCGNSYTRLSTHSFRELFELDQASDHVTVARSGRELLLSSRWAVTAASSGFEFVVPTGARSLPAVMRKLRPLAVHAEPRSGALMAD